MGLPSPVNNHHPDRFSEWSQAVWELQRAQLMDEEGARKFDFHYLGIYHETDGHMDSHKDLITGRAMSQWWDKCEQSGPASRSMEPFSIDPPALECLAISDGELKPLWLIYDGGLPWGPFGHVEYLMDGTRNHMTAVSIMVCSWFYEWIQFI